MKWDARKIIIFSCATLAIAAFIIRPLCNKKYEEQLAPYINTQLANDHLNVKVSIDVERIEYHHLGTDISVEHFVNDQPVSSNDVIPAKSTMSLTTVITEHDSYPDIGANEVGITIPPLPASRTFYVHVGEIMGRKYPEAYATFQVTYQFEPYFQNKVLTYWCVIFSLYNQTDILDFIEHILIVSLSIICIFLFMLHQRDKKYRDLAKKAREDEKKHISYIMEVYDTERMKIKCRYEHKQEIWERKERFRDHRSELYAKYEGVPIRSVLPIPENISFDEHWVPYIIGVPKEDLFIYIPQKGGKYHRKSCSHVNSSFSCVILWDVVRTYGPCEQCVPPHADFSWYDQFISFKTELARYGYVLSIEGGLIHMENRTKSKTIKDRD